MAVADLYAAAAAGGAVQSSSVSVLRGRIVSIMPTDNGDKTKKAGTNAHTPPPRGLQRRPFFSAPVGRNADDTGQDPPEPLRTSTFSEPQQSYIKTIDCVTLHCLLCLLYFTAAAVLSLSWFGDHRPWTLGVLGVLVAACSPSCTNCALLHQLVIYGCGTFLFFFLFVFSRACHTAESAGRVGPRADLKIVMGRSSFQRQIEPAISARTAQQPD